MYLIDVGDTYKQPRSVWRRLNFFIFGHSLKKFTSFPWILLDPLGILLILQNFCNRFPLRKKMIFPNEFIVRPRAQGGT